MRRAIGLGLATLAIALFGSVGRADNNTVTNAHQLMVNTGQAECVGTLNANEFFYAQLFAGRSYEIWAYVPGTERQIAANSGQPSFNAAIAVDVDLAFGNPLAATNDQFFREGGPGNQSWSHSRSVAFTVPATATYYVRVPTAYSTGCYQISLRETTLFSPWTSRAAGFEGFIELHNNTIAAVTVTLRAYDSAGALLGSALTFSIPGNATVFQTAGAVGVPAGVFAGIVATHDGTFGAISGNITTLNGASGLSFDSAFAPRSDSIRLH